jgi:predicted nucleotidyltransferase component of viral defense system
MLYQQTLAPETLSLLEKLSSIQELNNFTLAGGTALSLQIGHRISYDLDFFLQGDLSNEMILQAIENTGKIEIVSQSPRILVLLINNIKVDFIRHPYPSIQSPTLEQNLRLSGLKDIAAMKLHAIAGRGRRRDFVDLFFLLKRFSLKEIIAFYSRRFFDGNELMVVRSLSFFDDAESDPDVVYVSETVSWDEIKHSIHKAITSL